VSTAKEIEAAILALPPTEREKLVADLLALLPELNGDAKWTGIIHDPRPRRALSAVGDDVEAQYKASPDQFPEIKDTDFDTRQ